MNERGVALPMALIALLILSSLMVAFSVLAQSEPAIANNHMMSARARAFAESGIERAMWALNNPTLSGLSDPLTSSPTDPNYNGTTFNWVEQVNGTNQGGYKLTITLPNPANPNLVTVTALGYAPDDQNPRAIKKIQVDLLRFKFGGPAGTPPCAMCLGGETPTGDSARLDIGGSATVNGDNTQGSPAAVYCSGQTPTSAIMTTGTVNQNGHPDILAPPGGVAMIEHTTASTFTGFTLTDADMLTLKAYAKAKGLYYQGSQTFTSPPPREGILFIDTPSGNPLTQSSPSSDLITLDIHGNWTAPPWNGWIIVAGTADLSGNIKINGLIYAQNDVHYNGTGGGRITGAIIAQNRRDTVASTMDSETIGNGNVAYSCPAVRDGGGQVSNNWFPSPGSYKELQGT